MGASWRGLPNDVLTTGITLAIHLLFHALTFFILLMTDLQTFYIPPAGDYNAIFDCYNYTVVSGFKTDNATDVAFAPLPRKLTIYPQPEENTVPKHQ